MARSQMSFVCWHPILEELILSLKFFEAESVFVAEQVHQGIPLIFVTKLEVSEQQIIVSSGLRIGIKYCLQGDASTVPSAEMQERSPLLVPVLQMVRQPFPSFSPEPTQKKLPHRAECFSILAPHGVHEDVHVQVVLRLQLLL